MSIDLSSLAAASRLLFEIPLEPLQGHRFQPTGFPGLGAATFQTTKGSCLLVESAQSMANRLELTIWDAARNDVLEPLTGLSHVRVKRRGAFLTDTILESHRINSPYILSGSDRTFLDPFLDALREKLGAETINENKGLIDRKGFAEILLRYDIGSLLHGVFIANDKVKLKAGDKNGSTLAGGRLRVARALSAFIEADGVRIAGSGGVKNDHVNPSGDTKSGFGNVPFARDEFTAEKITLYVNIDLAQIRGYGLGADVENLLILLALYKLRALLDGSLRLRTACDLAAAVGEISARRPAGFVLPSTKDLLAALVQAIGRCAGKMQVGEVAFDDELKKGKDSQNSGDDADESTENGDD